MSSEEVILPTSLFIGLDRSGPIPLYFQVTSLIESAITDGTLAPGSRLENEVALSERLGLSRPTVRRAIQSLVDKGLVVRRRGIGTQVVQGQVTRGVELTSLFEDLISSGRKPSTEILTFRREKATHTVATALGIHEDDDVIFLHRIRLADTTPVSIMRNWLPADLLNFSEKELLDHGLYQVMRARGVSIRVAKQKIGARRATATESSQLDIEKNGALLTMERTAFDNSGRAVEYGSHCYRPDLYSFEVTLVEK